MRTPFWPYPIILFAFLKRWLGAWNNVSFLHVNFTIVSSVTTKICKLHLVKNVSFPFAPFPFETSFHAPPPWQLWSITDRNKYAIGLSEIPAFVQTSKALRMWKWNKNNKRKIPGWSLCFSKRDVICWTRLWWVKTTGTTFPISNSRCVFMVLTLQDGS